MLDEDQIDYFRTTFGDGVPPAAPIKAAAPAPAPIPAPIPAPPKPLSGNE